MSDPIGLRCIRQALCSVLLFLISSCASFGASTIEKLDPLTSATLTAVNSPMVFYRDNSGRAAFAKNFMNLGPVQVNRSGQYRYFLWIGAWSTGLETQQSQRRDGLESPVLFVDGEPVQLNLAGWTPEAIGASENIYTKPVASAIDAYYEVTIDIIRLLVNATDIQLRTGGASSEAFEPWDDQQAARNGFRDFFDVIGY